MSGPLPPGSFRASPARLALSARLPGPLAMSLSSSASALRLLVPPRLSISCFALRCRLLKFMEPPWFAPVVEHYDKPPGSDGGRNHRRLAARRQLLWASTTVSRASSDRPVLFRDEGCGGQRERAALGVPAYGPLVAGVDDRAAKFADALERSGQIRDGEVRKASGIAGTGSTIVDSQA